MSTDDPTPLDDDEMTTTNAGGMPSTTRSDVGSGGSLDMQDEGIATGGMDSDSTDGTDSDSSDGTDSDGTDRMDSDSTDAGGRGGGSADGVDQGPGPDTGPLDSA